jgi:glycosyltransferase involved in cell wall biosynthesis
MKVLIINYGGLTEDRRAMHREYARQGIDLSVIVPSFIPTDKTYSVSGFFAYNKDYDEAGYNIFPVDLINPGLIDSFNPFQLYKIIKKINPDIIHVFNEYTSLHVTEAVFCRNIIFKRYRKKIPIVVYTFENIDFYSSPFVFNFSRLSIKHNLNKILRKFIIFYHNKNVDAAFSCNNEGVEIMKNAGLKGLSGRIFRGADLNIFAEKDRKICRQKIGIPENIKLIGCFCRIVEEKGLDQLVYVLKKLNNYYLMIVGSGVYKEKIKQLAESLGVKERVYFFDSVKSDQLSDYYNCLDVFVLPSKTMPLWKEQYGMVLVEAMACKLPVVGSSSGAIPEVIENYPKSIIFQERDVEDLAEKIKNVQLLEFSENFDLEKFLYKFSIKNFVLENIKIYNHLLRK